LAGAGETIHATAIAVDRRAILIRGRSGSGKSDLALRCLAVPATPWLPAPVRLVADDRVGLRLGPGGRLVAFAPETIAGRMEVRGLGIVDMPYDVDAEIALVADLIGSEDPPIERLPDPVPGTTLLGRRIPSIRLKPFEPSAPIKLLLALARLPRMEPSACG
jgi:HPr kinase/phosphorylase